MNPDKAEPPQHLSEASRALWVQILEENSIDAAAVPVLMSYLEARDRREQARLEIIATGGPVTTDRFDKMKKNPWIEIERDATLMMQRAFRLLGFDQESRATSDQGKLF